MVSEAKKNNNKTFEAMSGLHRDLKACAAEMLIPDIRAQLQGSGGVQALLVRGPTDPSGGQILLPDQC